MNLKLMNGVYSKNNFPKTKDEAYLINLDDYKSIKTHSLQINRSSFTLYVNSNNVTYVTEYKKKI